MDGPPVIGITSFPRVVDVASGPTMLHTVSRFYVDAVRDAGGLPIIFPVLPPEAVLEVLSIVDGVLFTGGGDIDPAEYGEERDPATRGIQPERDAFELALARAVAESSCASLAICRGMQVVNVALGGSLVQHIEDQTGVVHDRADQWLEAVHLVRVDPASRLASLIGDVADVNSIHHQGVGSLAPDAVAVAWAPDGTVEAFEVGEELLAVQWHPELRNEPSRGPTLFTDLVQRAARRGESRSDERDSPPKR